MDLQLREALAELALLQVKNAIANQHLAAALRAGSVDD